MRAVRAFSATLHGEIGQVFALRGRPNLYSTIDKVLSFNDLRRVPHRNGCSELARDVQNDLVALEVRTYLSCKQIQANHSEGFVK